MRPWLPRLAELDEDWQAIVESPAIAPVLPLRGLIPQFEPQSGPELRWRHGPARIGTALDDVIWELVALTAASDGEIAEFAGRYGALTSVLEQGTPGARARWRLAAGTEPFEAWRQLASGLHALLTLATQLSEGEEVAIADQPDQWMTAFSAVTTVIWLLDPERDQVPPTSEQLYGIWLATRVDNSGLYTAPADEFRRLLGELLRHSGVHVVPATVGPGGRGRAMPRVRYQLPAVGLGRIEQLPEVETRSGRAGRAAAELPSLLYWRVASLLPVLTVQVARAVEPGEYYPCTRCGLLARVAGRRPGGNREWFGDHAYCRRVHRAAVLRRATTRFHEKGLGDGPDGEDEAEPE
jgi:hypothetical protein